MSDRSRTILVTVTLALSSLCAHAQNDSLGQDTNQEAYDILRHFGVGLSLTYDNDENRVDDAEIVNGIVRVNRDSSTRARVMLEWHSWMFCEHLDWDETDQNPPYRSVKRHRKFGDKKEYWKQEPPCLPSRRASGLFVAVQPGSESVIDAIGLGWMFRFPDKLQLVGNRTLNVGFGLIADQNVRQLGHGFVENAEPPKNAAGVAETQVRYRMSTQAGVFAMASLELGQAPVQIQRRSLTFYAERPSNQAQVALGDSVTLYWSAEDTDNCEASGAWMGRKSPQGQEQVKMETAGINRFTLTCVGNNNVRSNTRFVEIEVVAPPDPADGEAEGGEDVDPEGDEPADGDAEGEESEP